MLECAGPCTRPAAGQRRARTPRTSGSAPAGRTSSAAAAGRRRPSRRRSRRPRPRARGLERAVLGHGGLLTDGSRCQARIGSKTIPSDSQGLDLATRVAVVRMIGSMRGGTHGHCPGCAGSTTSASPCPTSTRRTGSWSTCSAASTSTRSARSADDGDWMAEHLNVHPRAVMVENRFFRCGDQAVFEVFDYDAPDQRDMPPRNSDVGGHHVALYVDDLDAAVGYLRGARGHGARRADRQPRAAPRASAGSTSSPVGHAVRAGLLSRRQGVRAARAERPREPTETPTATSAGERAGRGLPARRDPRRRDRPGRADPPGGGRRAARREPAAGPRGAAHAGGRGAGRARAQQGRAGAAADHARGRRRSTGCGSGSSRSRWPRACRS